MPVLIRLAAALFGLAALVDAAGADPRHEIEVSPYRAAATPEKQDALAEFRGVLFGSLQNYALSLYFELKGTVDEAHIRHLAAIEDVNLEEEIRNFASARTHILRYGSLAIMAGTVRERDGGMEFYSDIYVDAATDPERPAVRPFRVIYQDNEGAAEELEAAHLFFFLYALATDAAKQRLPEPVILTLQRAAQNTFNDMNDQLRTQNAAAMDEIAGLLQ